MTTGQSGKRWKWPQVIQSLLSTATIAQAATQAGVSERSILRWLSEEGEFQELYARTKRQALDSTVNALRMGGYDAATRLHTVVVDKDAPPAVAVSASWRLLDLLLKADEIENLSVRLDRLEAAALKDGER
jgi:hypothetical protein